MQHEIIELVLNQAMRAPAEGIQDTAIDALKLLRSDEETAPRHSLYVPALCVAFQGAKELVTGDQMLRYEELEYLVVKMDMPAVGRVITASPRKPFLGLVLGIDVDVLRDMAEVVLGPERREPSEGRVEVCKLEPPVMEGLHRLLRLLETPSAIPTLYPLIAKEIYYWLLTGPNANAVANLALPSVQEKSIAKAIQAIRRSLGQPMSVDELSDLARMSPSSFHAHFKAATSMTPVQYQKRLRLLEARRLLRSNLANATEAATEVGYESLSQFSRDYAKFFGAPPRRDLALSH